jgi:acyl dehydratase/NAD(P)-dependent dehydrogenase (short-subunit alcohol dehydrogenase family)
VSAAPGFVIEAAASADFARLSGDFNPLHVDDLAARRLQFGGTVCHGVHLVLRSIEHIAASGALAGHSVAAVSAVFHQPVRTGVPVRLGVVADAAGLRFRITGTVDGRTQFSAQLQVAEGCGDRVDVPESKPETDTGAQTPSFPADPSAQHAMAGTVALRLNLTLLTGLFPALARWSDGPALAADLMATTHIVGMRCPGLHSIYSEFKLMRRGTPLGQPAMAFEVSKADARFQKVRIVVQGALMTGMLEAFFRAPPVAQRSLAEVAALTAAGCLAGQKALVVGGSRGLGELAAKMLLAGGADVTLSYARGRADAERIVAEAQAAGARANTLCLDTSQPLAADTASALAAAGYTHVYYFATPSIAKSPPGSWNPDLYERYTRIYVTGFAAVVHAATQAHVATPLKALYPSTVFLDKAEKGFAEYCCAKAAGETLCDHLTQDGRVQVQHPRLPRMKTDQNSSFLGPEADDPWPVLAATLAQFCGYRAATPA